MVISEVLKIVRFGIVGAAATATHLLLAAGLLAMHFGISVFLINLMAFCGAFPVSYLGHRYFTFAAPGSSRKFALVAIGGFLMNTFILGIVISAFNIGGLVAIAISTLTVPILIYLASRLWVFG